MLEGAILVINNKYRPMSRPNKRFQEYPVALKIRIVLRIMSPKLRSLGEFPKYVVHEISQL